MINTILENIKKDKNSKNLFKAISIIESGHLDGTPITNHSLDMKSIEDCIEIQYMIDIDGFITNGKARVNKNTFEVVESNQTFEDKREDI